jgi:3-deoxy-D-manno-octulosonic-acid transferase
MYMALYNTILTLASPLISCHLNRRLQSGKEDMARFSERLGTPSHTRPTGVLIWIHAASVGESVSVLPLINGLLETSTDRHVMVTTGTRTSAAIMQDRLPKGAFHQYVPIDKKDNVNRFLDYWKPDIGLWIESEIWPNLIRETNRRQIPTMLVNARITEKSFNKWRRFPGLSNLLFGGFEECTAQSDISAERLRSLGAKNVTYLGNLKFAAEPLPYDEVALSDLKSLVHGRPVWLAASTHPGEEQQVIEVHKILKQAIPEILTIIVPRHPERGKEVNKIVTDQGLSAVRRSLTDPVAKFTDIYLADTMGELGLFYRLSDIVFIGGSLVEKGGQNLLEAARLDCAILHGPHMDNFSEVTKEFRLNAGAEEVKDSPELAKSVAMFLSNVSKRNEIAENAKRIASKGQEICQLVVSKVNNRLKGKQS